MAASGGHCTQRDGRLNEGTSFGDERTDHRQFPECPAASEAQIEGQEGRTARLQRKDAKGKTCGGHLKRWFYTTDVVEQECGCIERAWGRDAEVYRCENCKTLYVPNPDDVHGINVGGQGQISVFGLTIPGKER